MTFDYDISLATPNDIPGILALQEANLPDSGGTLSVRLTPNWFQDAVLEKSVIVGRRESKVVGYVVGSSFAANAHVTIIQTMLRTFLPASGCYVYGPMCVAETERGKSAKGNVRFTHKSRHVRCNSVCPLWAKRRPEQVQQEARYSMTSSARNKSDVGMVIPSARAVRMLSTVSNFVGRSIGSSPGLAPRRTLPARTPVS